MNKRIEKFLGKVNTPEYQKNYLENTAPKISRLFGSPGDWRNKRHDPQTLGDTICPICAIKNGLHECGPEFLNIDIRKVTTTKMGNIIENSADKLVFSMLKKFNKKVWEKKKNI